MYGLGAVSRMTYCSKLTTNPTQHKAPGSAHAASMNDPNGDADALAFAERMRDFIEAIREKTAQLIELIEQIANGRFVGRNLTKNLREQAEKINAALDVLWGHITETLTSSILGSQDYTASSINSGPELGLDQILNVEQRITAQNAYSELAVFSLAQIREAAMKALRCQGNLEPEKALFLLQDDMT